MSVHVPTRLDRPIPASRGCSSAVESVSGWPLASNILVYNEVLLGRASLDRLPIGVALWANDDTPLFANRQMRQWLGLGEGLAPDAATLWQVLGTAPPAGESGKISPTATGVPTAMTFVYDVVRNLEGQPVARALYLAPAVADAAVPTAGPRTLAMLLFRSGRLAAWVGLSARWPALDDWVGAAETAVLDHLARAVQDGMAPHFAPARETLSDGSVLLLAQGDDSDAAGEPGEPFGPEGLIAATAHEIRNPLATIRGFLQILPDAEAEDRRRYAGIALREVDRIADVVNEFLRTSGHGDGAAPTADLVHAARSAAQFLEDEADLTGVELRLDLPDHPVWVEGHATRLRQAVHNLLRNALASVPSPGGHVDLTVREDGRWVHLAVEDDGPGVPEEWAERIFQPAFSRREGGHGLGLAIARWIVTMYHGTIEVGRSPAGGARFAIHLPVLPLGAAATTGDMGTPLA